MVRPSKRNKTKDTEEKKSLNSTETDADLPHHMMRRIGKMEYIKYVKCCICDV
jgi:hypothetical protein